jgi:hypothetical protein
VFSRQIFFTTQVAAASEPPEMRDLFNDCTVLNDVDPLPEIDIASQSID